MAASGGVASVVGQGRRFVARHGLSGLASAAVRAVSHRVVPVKPERLVDLPAANGDPLAALRLADGATPLIRVPMASLRTYALSLPIDDARRQPFTRTVAEHLADPTGDYDTSTLRRFYDEWRPAALGEVYGVAPASRSGLGSAPSPDCLPWTEGANLADITAGRDTHRQKVIDLIGSPAAFGYRSFGPVSADAADVYFRDFVDLADSIVDRGYIEGLDGYPSIQVLTDGDRWAGRLLAGNHRCVVLAAMGVDDVLVRVAAQMVRRSEVRSWPGVRGGLYMPDEALTVFDHFLDGTPPAGFPDFGTPLPVSGSPPPRG